MAKDSETPTSVQYRKFEDDDGESSVEAPKTANNNMHSPPKPTENVLNHSSNHQAQAITEPEVITTDSPSVSLPMHEVIINGASSTANETEADLTWNWLNLVLSIASIFCCTVCGVLATVTSVLAYVDYRVNDLESSRRKRLASYALALTALIAGLLVMVIVIVVAIHYDRH